MMSFIAAAVDTVKGKPEGRKLRSKHWRKVRLKHLENNPICCVCAGTKKVEVHHIIPFHLRPDLELCLDNLMTLCERKKYGINCHLLIGHLGNYRKVNNDSVEDACRWNRKIKGN